MSYRRPFAAAVLACVLLGGMAGCSRHGSMPTETIAGVAWTLVEVDGATVDPAQMNRPATLLLDADGRASGSAGCNQFGGPYTITGDEIRFGAIAMTRMACPDRMDVESAYAAVFEAARTWRVRDGMLELMADGRILARFRR